MQRRSQAHSLVARGGRVGGAERRLAGGVPTVIDTLFERSAEGEWLIAYTVKGAGGVDTLAVLAVRGVLAFVYICKGHHRQTRY